MVYITDVRNKNHYLNTFKKLKWDKAYVETISFLSFSFLKKTYPCLHLWRHAQLTSDRLPCFF